MEDEEENIVRNPGKTRGQPAISPEALGDIIHSIPCPADWAGDLAWDGSSLWVNDDDGTVYQLDPSDGHVIKSIVVSIDYPRGMTWDGEYLWISSYYGMTIYKVNPNDGSIVHSIPSLLDTTGGLAWDGEALWTGGFGSPNIFRLSPSDGAILHTIPAPDTVTRGLTWDGEFLWVCESNSDIDDIYKINPSDGTIILSFVPSGLTPDWYILGLAWDGQYLWNNEKTVGNVINQIDVGAPPPPPPIWPPVYKKIFKRTDSEAALSALRSYRDWVVIAHPKGKELVFELYEKHSLSLAKTLLTHPRLMQQGAKMIKKNLREIASVIDGGKITMSPKELAEVNALLDDLTKVSNPELKAYLKSVQNVLQEESALVNFGITVGKEIKAAPKLRLKDKLATTWSEIKRTR